MQHCLTRSLLTPRPRALIAPLRAEMATTALVGFLKRTITKSIGLVLAGGMVANATAACWRRGQSLWFPDPNPPPLPDPLPDLVHEYVTVRGIKLHLVRTCTNPGGTKPVILLLHGFPEGWFSWRHQMEALRGEWCVVAMDLRGYGGSDKPQDVASYRMQELAADVAGVIEAIASPGGSGKVVLCGHDWGALVSWATSIQRPELIERLVVMCAPHPACYLPNLDWDQAKRSWYIAAFQTPWLPEAALKLGNCNYIGAMINGRTWGCQNRQALTQEDVERYKRAFALPGVATAAINYYRAAIDYSLTRPDPNMIQAQKRKLPMPVMLLWADHDVALGPQLLCGTEKYADSLRIEMVKGASHWVQQDRPAEVNRMLREFLTQTF